MSIWHGCYDEGWGDLIVKEAFAHPAKYAYGLIKRIIEHGLERGYWAKGDLIGDPFGGIASGGIVAGYHGLHWIGVELEPRFVELGNQNLVRHCRQHADCCGSARLVQGDSRMFAEIVGEAAGIVTSPPFEASLSDKPSDSVRKMHGANMGRSVLGVDGYGQTPGNIGNLSSGSIDAILTSPPYAESVRGEHGETETAADSRDKRLTPGGSLGQSARHGGYGVTEGQIGALKEGVDAVVTSPPFEDSIGTKDQAFWDKHNDATSNWNGATRATADYGHTAGQIGNEQAETYWSAMRAVYGQCRLALKPGGVMAVVIKSYIKGGKLVDLPQQTWDLLLHLGFDPVERVRAMLVKEEKHPSLFGGEHTRKKERKSFFRRLAEKKGSPPIDFEEVLFVRRPDNQ